jgi:hypothetical protein
MKKKQKVKVLKMHTLFELNQQVAVELKIVLHHFPHSYLLIKREDFHFQFPKSCVA